MSENTQESRVIYQQVVVQVECCREWTVRDVAQFRLTCLQPLSFATFGQFAAVAEVADYLLAAAHKARITAGSLLIGHKTRSTDVNRLADRTRDAARAGPGRAR